MRTRTYPFFSETERTRGENILKTELLDAENLNYRGPSSESCSIPEDMLCRRVVPKLVDNDFSLMPEEKNTIRMTAVPKCKPAVKEACVDLRSVEEVARDSDMMLPTEEQEQLRQLA
eukprot:CAMPEP_0196591682 /NCGR_PEP_ID=MMETSP1081-20130531/70555_1 /TAXON_ID=36882 /ORGANISM="Pyramimonas amylifera, Strain CCMP720" /LENGTH=116 /DNA_ID=CAMNT_0041915121 /DNA_START=1 /DNA_END=347 /DNA_ORIENTATION=-